MPESLRTMQHSIESALRANLPQCRRPGAKLLDDALQYAVFPGGKRLRPMLSLLGARIFRSEIGEALPAACAVEFIHTSSLIFDDLPCMDDAAIRRGIPVVHKVYGEDVALLTAIALLNASYGIFGRVPLLIEEAADCIGVEGMIGGQALDLTAHRLDDLTETERSRQLSERNRKTSAMMRLALTAGSLACGIPADEVEALGIAGQALGEAYQIGDDLLDSRRSSHYTGKTAGQDRRHSRASHGILDEHACIEELHAMVARTKSSLTAAYGADRIAELMGFVDAMFAALTSAAGREV